MERRKPVPDYIPETSPRVELVPTLWRCAACGADIAPGESHVQVIGYGSADTRCVAMRHAVKG